jgi:hypothetical protein
MAFLLLILDVGLARFEVAVVRTPEPPKERTP